LSQTRELAETLSIPTPSVQIVPNETPFAFSSGIFSTQTRLFISQGLVQKLAPAEVQAVLTYEMQRTRYAHTRAASAAMALAGILSSIANSFDTLMVFPFRLRSKRWRPWAPATLIMFPIVALLVRLAVSRRSVYEADRLTARTMDGSRALADALMKLDAYGKTMPVDVNVAEASLFTVNPLARRKGWRIAFPQPAAEDRIHALLGHYPP
jgi:heat shock protein HtpX